MNTYLFKLSKFKARDASMLSRFSRVQLFAALWTVARSASLSLGFSRQEYWSELPFPPPRDLLDPRIEPAFLTVRVRVRVRV